jgi:putative NADH-flavin reductase
MQERTGEYVAHDDHIPISGDGDLFKDKLLGISIADFAIAIVDEAKTEAHVFQHWTVTGSLEDDTPTPSYVTI